MNEVPTLKDILIYAAENLDADIKSLSKDGEYFEPFVLYLQRTIEILKEEYGYEYQTRSRWTAEALNEV